MQPDMSTRIVVFSDTHCHTWDEVHPCIRAEVADADIAIHCGDIVRMDVVDGLRETAKRSITVHGNSDPPDVRNAIPYLETLEVEGLRIGVTHPAWGGPEFPPEDLLGDFEEPPPSPECIDLTKEVKSRQRFLLEFTSDSPGPSGSTPKPVWPVFLQRFKPQPLGAMRKRHLT